MTRRKIPIRHFFEDSSLCSPRSNFSTGLAHCHLSFNEYHRHWIANAELFNHWFRFLFLLLRVVSVAYCASRLWSKQVFRFSICFLLIMEIDGLTDEQNQALSHFRVSNAILSVLRARSTRWHRLGIHSHGFHRNMSTILSCTRMGCRTSNWNRFSIQCRSSTWNTGHLFSTSDRWFSRPIGTADVPKRKSAGCEQPNE